MDPEWCGTPWESTNLVDEPSPEDDEEFVLSEDPVEPPAAPGFFPIPQVEESEDRRWNLAHNITIRQQVGTIEPPSTSATVIPSGPPDETDKVLGFEKVRQSPSPKFWRHSRIMDQMVRLFAGRALPA